MELVYLWVEEYKNIKKQGFSFSPNFKCKYLSDKYNLTIDEKRLISIFPEKINITAIVGENGSGKSSLFKIIIYLFSNYFTPEKSLIDTGGKFFLIIKIGNEYRILENNFKDIKCNQKLEHKHKWKPDFYSVYVNYMMDSLKDGVGETWVDEYYYRNDNYETPILLEPNKKNNKIDLDSLDFIAEQRFDWQFLVGETNEVIKGFFDPDVVIINADSQKIKSKLKRLSRPVFGDPVVSYMSVGNKTFGDFNNIFKQSIEDLEKEIDVLFDNANYLKINMIYFALKILSSNLTNISIFNELVEVVKNDNLFAELIDVIEKRGMETIYKEDIVQCEHITFATKDKLRYCVNFGKIANKVSRDDLKSCKLQLKGRKDKDYVEKLRSYPMWITKTYYEGDNPPNGNTLAKLSSGEKTYLKFLMMLVYEIEQIKTNKEHEYNTINFFLDEIELTMHPNWQKRLLKDIIQIFEKSGLKFNLIISSHSPFILSDLPKENVIFLKKNKDGNCENETAKVEIYTFGANIHTLLSNGFFMKDGLMAEFAKEKITNIKNFYYKVEDKENPRKKYQKEYSDAREGYKYIQNIIGEPFLQTIIKNYLDELDGIFYDKNDLIDKKLKEIEEQKINLENMKKMKNVKD